LELKRAKGKQRHAHFICGVANFGSGAVDILGSILQIILSCLIARALQNAQFTQYLGLSCRNLQKGDAVEVFIAGPASVRTHTQQEKSSRSQFGTAQVGRAALRAGKREDG